MMRTKRFLEVVALSFCFCIVLACNKGKDQQEKLAEKTEAQAEFHGDSVQLVEQIVKRYNSQDLSGVVALFAPNLQWTHITATKPLVRGRPQLARHLMRERSIFPDSQIAIRRIIDKKDLVVFQGVFRATQKGVAQGMAPSGKKVSYDFIYFMTVDDSQVRSNVAYLNPVTPLRQMGAIVVESATIPDWPSKTEIVREEGPPDNENLVKQFYAAWSSGNFSGLGEMFAADSLFLDRSKVASISGYEPIEKMLLDKSQQYKGLSYQIESMHSAGDYVVVRGTLKGTRTMVPDGKSAPEAREVVVPETHVFRLTNGKIAQMELYFDELHEYKQFGYTMATVLIALGEKNAKTKLNPVQKAGDTGHDPVEAATSSSDRRAESSNLIPSAEGQKPSLKPVSPQK